MREITQWEGRTMAITESRRFDMFGALREKLGPDVAETLIEHLPPTGWGDVARRSDVDRLETQFNRLESRFSQLEHEFRNLETRLNNRFQESETRIDEKFNAFEERLMLRTETMINKAINRQLWIMLSFTGAMVIAMVSGILNQ
jgi:predicted nuclease with TOPRIM domain